MQNQPHVVVVGSINMDLVVRCPSLPKPGETILAEDVQELPGGKGANQAVAASRMGGAVSMVGRVGDDAFGSELLKHLRDQGVETSHVRVSSEKASGLAVVSVDDKGENSILVVPGANACVSQEDVWASRELIQNADVLLVQLEIPVETVVAAVKIANQRGVKVVLDPAPSIGLLPEELKQVDLICPNVPEAEAILNCEIFDRASAESAATKLHERGFLKTVITLGENGALYTQEGSSVHAKGFEVAAVDTTAAGDAFAGTLAVQWNGQNDLGQAVAFANAAGALTAGRLGAQTAMPDAEEVQAIQTDGVLRDGWS